MNATASVVVSVLAASAAAVAISITMQPPQATGEAPIVAELQASLRDLQDVNEQLAQRLDAFGNRLQQASAPDSIERTEAPTVSSEQIAAAVDAYMQKHGGSDAPATVAGESGSDGGFDLEKDLDELMGSRYFENTEAWKKALAAGKMDEVIAEIEAMAKANPNDVQSQMNLANAYMAYLQMDSSKWDMSMKADAQFDKVLDIDENHWEARFTKAVSYTFWPAFLGKGKDAISNFETLIKQQEMQPVQDHHAQTYLYLGNMVADRDPARAREIWQKGIARHPADAALLEKLGG